MDNQLIAWGIIGTISIWFYSALFAVVVALMLASGVAKGSKFLKRLCYIIINITRGIPTSVLVLAAGIATMQLMPAADMPVLIPATPSVFQLLAWAIILALGLGSAGHLAEIFLAAYTSIGHIRLEQAVSLGLSTKRQCGLLCRECASRALPAVSSRLIHHLHNTAFAALFPVTELFGITQSQANNSFEVMKWILITAVVYIILSACIWLLTKLIEVWLMPTKKTWNPGRAVMNHA